MTATYKPIPLLAPGDRIRIGSRGWLPIHHVDRSHDGQRWRDTRVLVRDGYSLVEYWLPSRCEIAVEDVVTVPETCPFCGSKGVHPTGNGWRCGGCGRAGGRRPGRPRA